MSAEVDLDRLAEALGDYGFAYLITVNDDYRVRAVEVDPVFDRKVFDVGPVGDHTRANLSRHGTATLVWPPRDPGGYSLIVDADIEAPVRSDARDSVRLVPTRALLHRPTTGSRASECGGQLYDCVVFKASSSATA
jgi:hypothetical protein